MPGQYRRRQCDQGSDHEDHRGQACAEVDHVGDQPQHGETVANDGGDYRRGRVRHLLGVVQHARQQLRARPLFHRPHRHVQEPLKQHCPELPHSRAADSPQLMGQTRSRRRRVSETAPARQPATIVPQAPPAFTSSPVSLSTATAKPISVRANTTMARTASQKAAPIRNCQRAEALHRSLGPHASSLPGAAGLQVNCGRRRIGPQPAHCRGAIPQQVPADRPCATRTGSRRLRPCPTAGRLHGPSARRPNPWGIPSD